VRCQVLLDGLASRRSARTLSPRLQAAGVEVRLLLPIGFLRRTRTRLDLRNHRKLAVVDGRIGYVGSQNLVNPDFKKGITYEELVARVTGPVVWQLQAVFLADRFVETGTPEPDLAHLFPEQVAAGPSPAQALPSAPGYEYENTQRLIVALIHGARERVVITTPYFIPDEPLLEAMQTAVLRGVEIHLVVSHLADQVLVCLAQRSYYEELLKAGVHLHLYRRYFLHAKHLSIDDSIALIGSSNMDIRSFALNAEISLLIYDPQVVARLRQIQQRYFAEADLLTLEQWQRRPRLAKITQNIARLVDALL
jgi:cardiolipin synthase